MFRGGVAANSNKTTALRSAVYILPSCENDESGAMRGAKETTKERKVQNGGRLEWMKKTERRGQKRRAEQRQSEGSGGEEER